MSVGAAAHTTHIAGLWFPESAHVVDPFEVSQALVAAPRIDASAVVVCAGPWSAPLLKTFGLHAVHAVDQQRVGFIEQVFRDLGYKGKQAHVRARVTYYHQVGYYALTCASPAQRLELILITRRF